MSEVMEKKTSHVYVNVLFFLTLFRLGLFEGGLGLEGGGGECPRPITFKTINDNEMELGGVVKNH